MENSIFTTKAALVCPLNVMAKYKMVGMLSAEPLYVSAHRLSDSLLFMIKHTLHKSLNCIQP